MLVERLFFAEQNALLCGEDVWLCMCGCVRVGFDKKRKRVIIIVVIEGSKSRGEI